MFTAEDLFNVLVIFRAGNAVDDDVLDHLSREGLRHVTDVRLDDMFIVTDSQVLIKANILNFFKFYDGVPEVISFKYKTNVFGFFWQLESPVVNQFEPSAVTVRFFRDFYDYRGSEVNLNNYNVTKTTLEMYRKKGLAVDPLNIDNSGWRCQWCLQPQTILTKIDATTRKGFLKTIFMANGESGKIQYILSLIKNGRNFDGTKLSRGNEKDNFDFAPAYMLENRHLFVHLIEHENYPTIYNSSASYYIKEMFWGI